MIMMFNSIEFIAFFIVTLIVIFFIDKYSKTPRLRDIALLIISISYYAIIDIKYLLLLIFITLFTYFIGLRVNKNKKIMAIGVSVLGFILTFFKYNNFFISRISSDVFETIIMPIGISFYIFKAISYIVDVYNSKYEAEKDFVIIGLYLALFTEIVSGPISRFQDLKKQFDSNTKINSKQFCEGMQIFVFGLFKKIVIADNLSVFVNEIYRTPKVYSSITIWLCVVGYAIEIYMDFSGYSDMSIGCSNMLGFDIKQNFNCPYISKNISEFWKRWHISLSNWIMEYIYIPLGGNRNGKARQYLNLIITMTITGLWHGSSYMFAIWGLVNGFALVIQKKFLNKDNIFNIALNYFFILFAWIIFKADSMNNFVDIINQLWFKDGINYISSWTIFAIVFVIFDVALSLRNDKQEYYPMQDLSTVKGLTVFFVILGLTLGLGYTGLNPFIYSSF